MTIRECYDVFGGDFDGVMKRLIDENRVERFALKFLDESSMKQLRISLIEDDQESAFRAAHKRNLSKFGVYTSGEQQRSADGIFAQRSEWKLAGTAASDRDGLSGSNRCIETIRRFVSVRNGITRESDFLFVKKLLTEKRSGDNI